MLGSDFISLEPCLVDALDVVGAKKTHASITGRSQVVYYPNTILAQCVSTSVFERGLAVVSSILSYIQPN